MSWDNYIYFVIPSILFWVFGSIFSALKKKKLAITLFSIGTAVFATYIIGFWGSLGRPPLRTMGETRLWYSFFMGIVGVYTYYRWEYRWILSYSTLMAAVFALINVFKPEIHSQALMPALQSIWFVPHVTIYMFAYSVLGASFILACIGMYTAKKELLNSIDDLVKIGLCCITFGMLTGAIWAKSAWGDFWTWDIKETWALITYLFYALYLHLRIHRQIKPRLLFLIILISFLSLQMCWWGVNYLPAAIESIHSYT